MTAWWHSEPLLQPHHAHVVERRQEADIVGGNRLLGHRERAMQDGGGLAQPALLTVEEAEGGKAPREPRVGRAEGLGLLHRPEIQALRLRGLSAVPRALRGAEQILPAL